MPALLTRMSRRSSLGDGGGDGCGAGYVEMERLGGADGFGQGFGGGDIDVGDPDEGAGADEFLDGGFADAAGAAGDEGVAAVETKGLGLRSSKLQAYGWSSGSVDERRLA